MNSSSVILSPRSRILILNYGSQYADLIARRCRECHVFAQMYDATVDFEFIRSYKPKGIILSGGPASVYKPGAPHITKELWTYAQEESIPILGICYGMQDMQEQLGGKVENALVGEFGPKTLILTNEASDDMLFSGVVNSSVVWMSHRDVVVKLCENFKVLATTNSCSFAAASCPEKLLWAVQFHPEVYHTAQGKQIFSNFFHKICKVPENYWSMHNYLTYQIKHIEEKVKDRHVIGALSGGVDSLVASALVYKAIKKKFHAVFVDTGLLRKNEVNEVSAFLKTELPGIELVVVDASERFFKVLSGVLDPEEKRKRVGHEFVNIFMDAIENIKQKHPAETLENCLLLQGTICTDVIESAEAHSGLPQNLGHKIKTHHNVGGLPEKLDVELLEPLRSLFKDEVRILGIELGITPALVERHPFPGPGFSVRIVGEVTRERTLILQQVDGIFMDEIKSAGLYTHVAQAFAVLLPDCHSVGIAGDNRVYGMTVVLRAVNSTDFMTADWFAFPHEVLRKTATRISNEVEEIKRVCYDISSKPPATIEWE